MSKLSLGTAGEKIIKSHEGFSLKFYGDPKGYPTVGWGHLITKEKTYKKNTTGNAADTVLTQKEADELSKKFKLGYTSPITEAKAEKFFISDTAKFETDVNNLDLPKGAEFSQSQFDALVSLAYTNPSVLATNDVKKMLKNPKIYPTYKKDLTETESDACSKLVSNAFSFDEKLKPRRNAEATLFCKGQKYTHKYPVYSL